MKLRSGKKLDEVKARLPNPLLCDTALNDMTTSLISDTSLAESELEPSLLQSDCSMLESETSEQSFVSCEDEGSHREGSCEDEGSCPSTPGRQSDESEDLIPICDPADNYNIDYLSSGDETDDEDAPSLPIPGWVGDVRAALVQQFTNSNIHYSQIFSSYDSPDLDLLFQTKKPQFKNRTSSAIWNTPPARGDESALDFSTLTIDELSE